MKRLPIHDVLAELCSALQCSNSAVLAAPPGSGKTTIVPLELLKQSWFEGDILMLEPRRLAARAAAARMADLLGERVGARVGYRVRFDSCVSSKNRIEVVTEGILTRRLQRDPELDGVGLVIFDEFHERSIHADLALALTLDIMSGLRDDLKLLIMSATLDTSAVSELLGGAQVITGGGRPWPVTHHYLERDPEKNIPETAANGVRRALGKTQGDILVFLPGTGEIRRTEQLLLDQLGEGVGLYPLYGDLSREEQDSAIRPHQGGKRRVVLATSIAETSLTIEGIQTVIDSGWSRVPRFNPNSGLTRLETVRVSLASADQRAGRAGRLGPGVCYRLWSEQTQARLTAYRPPEILDADLVPLVLDLAQWGVENSEQLKWMDNPPAGAFAQARSLLQALDGLDEKGRITSAGQGMAALSLHPRLAHMLLQAAARGQLELAADLAGLISERDIIRRRRGEATSVDVDDRLQLLQLWRRKGNGAVAAAGADPLACAQLNRAGGQWRKQIKVEKSDLPALSSGGLMSLAYPDRIAKWKGGDNSKYLLSSGRAVRLPDGDVLGGCPFLVVPLLDAGKREGRAFLASTIDFQEIRETQRRHIILHDRVAWDKGSSAVLARREERLGALLLSSAPNDSSDPDDVLKAMLEGIRLSGLDTLPWSREAREWQARLCSLLQWQPDSEWPDLSDQSLLENLQGWLGSWLNGISRKAHLKQLNMLTILQSRLQWNQQRSMDRLVPTHIQVPSGSRKRLEYRPGEAPVLAVRLQELFGLEDTPTVCHGEIKVVLHILSPAQRPIQVTQDLKGFWQRTYTEVKKELKGRYPKHYWPDDPFTAQPTARVRPR